jgi:hypothetical protein
MIFFSSLTRTFFPTCNMHKTFVSPKLTNQYPLINPSFVAASGVNRHVKSPLHLLDIEMGSFGDKQ